MAGCKKTAEPAPDDGSVIPSSWDTNTSSLSTNLPPVISTGTNVEFPPLLETSTPPVQLVNTNPPVDITPPPAQEQGVREHTIVAKDSFYTLAKQYNVTTKAIQDANPGVDSKRLKIGQKIKIPAPTAPKAATTTSTVSSASGDQKIYTVKSGDRLSTIATREHTTVNAIKSANGLRTDRITVGQKLKIPVKAAAAPKAAAVTTTAPVTTAPVTTAPLTESVTGFPPITPASAPTTPTVTP
jgi:LysM repeat protein